MLAGDGLGVAHEIASHVRRELRDRALLRRALAARRFNHFAFLAFCHLS
jgi:hypothetical protein